MGIARLQDRLHGKDTTVRARLTVDKTNWPTVWFHFKIITKPK